MSCKQEKYFSPFGVLSVCFNGSKVVSLSFLNEMDKSLPKHSNKNSFFGEWLKNYVEGAYEPFPSKYLDFAGLTSFQIKVYHALCEIPFGCTLTYAQVAKNLAQPKACRAVGQANKKNPFPLIVPCHRVVASNGLGGYSGGLTLKKNLLKFEGAL